MFLLQRGDFEQKQKQMQANSGPLDVKLRSCITWQHIDCYSVAGQLPTD